MTGASRRSHGYARAKLDGCRCYACRFAVSQYNEARERAIAYGTWQSFVDAEPVRQHLQNLQACKIGLRRIAQEVGTDRKRLQLILTGRPEQGIGPQKRVRPQLAAAVLAIQPSLDLLGAATVIDATGTHRRLQALVAAGWPQHHLAAALGWTDTNFSALLQQKRVTVRTARAVRELYDQMWRLDPREHGVDTKAYSRARNHAAHCDWAPVGAWDDDTIDDPAAQPDTGTCVPRGVALVEDATELITKQEYTREQAAARLGVTKKALDQAFSRYSRTTQDPSPKPAPAANAA